jgi:hypothetical protein
MKKVILLLLFVPFTAYGQVIENFESGNADNWVQSVPGHWKADSVSALSGKFSLHHIFDNPDAGIDRIGLRIKDLHPSEGQIRWSFILRHGYDPSSSNNWAVLLMTDAEPAATATDEGANGYALGVDLTGNDDTLRLWKVKGNLVTTVINSHLNWQTVIGINDAAKMVVERSVDGNWDLSVFRMNGTLIKAGTGTDVEFFNPSWFEIYYKYTSTKDRLLWVDDIQIDGKFYTDNDPPFVTETDISGRNSVEITFNEEPVDELMKPENFSLNISENKALSVNRKSSVTYDLEFAGPFNNKSLNNLIINKLCDKTGNCSQDVQVPFTPVWAETGDVIISEIMADPLPEVSLPGKEYLEITNRTEYSFDLKNWKLTSAGQSYLFPETVMKPSEIRIVCSSADTSQFKKYGSVTGLKQFPALTIGGKLICLTDSTGNLIHGVEYTSAWYKDELKTGGGWSLEMIDTNFPFYSDGNWIASSSRNGGTPGSVNSVAAGNQDISFYGIQNVFPLDSLNIVLRFSEPVFDLPAKSIKFEEKEISSIQPADPLFREFSVALNVPLIKNRIYTVQISDDIKDFAGNPIQLTSFKFGLPDAPSPGDVLFNELLFNALPGDPDYLELYNNSKKILDASRLQLISINDETGDTSQISLVSDERRSFLPDTYYAITVDRKKIIDRYFSADPGNLFETGSLPTMPDDKGHIVLLNRELDVIDQVFYTEKMQYSLLSDYEGVALEKIGKHLKSEDAKNWHSASESSGWGTPGAQNSVLAEIPSGPDKVVFSSTKITPDNDGYEDYLQITLNLEGIDNVISVSVFDETGNYIRNIAKNLLAGQQALLSWDGTSDDGSLVRTGIYIILINLFDDKGKTEKWKKVCTVIRN